MLLLGLAAWSATLAANPITSTLLGAAPATAPAAETGSIEDLRTQLEAEKKAAAIIESAPDFAVGAPPTATDDELKLRRYYVLERIRAIESQIRSAIRLSELNQQLEQTRDAANIWTKLEQPPPYSVALVDELVREKLAAESQLQSQETRRNLIRAMRDTMSATLKELAIAIRQREEALSTADSTRKAALAWSLELDRQRLRTSSSIVKSLEATQKINDIELAMAGVSAALASRKAEAAQSESAFSDADYKRVQNALDAESKSIAQELSRAVDTETAATRRLERSVETLAQQQALAASDPSGAEASPRIEALKHAVALAEIEVSAANASLDVLRIKPSSTEMKRAIWDYRFRLSEDRSPQLVAEARKNLGEVSSKLTVLTQIVERQKEILRAEIADRAQVLQAASDQDKRELLNRAQDFDLAREGLLRSVEASFGSTRYLLSRADEELGKEGKKHQWGSGLKSAYYLTAGFLRDAWNFELFAIEDTIDVEGKKVSGYTSITVGKILRAVFLFVAGVFLSLWLSRLAETFVVRRFGYDPAQARILRKWMSTAGLGILLVAVLVWVRIPLTVFAFLGGAVAIGLGFGMQNLLKNLISGLMLLFERPFRAGDLVEVGPVRGNIVEIGIRSSVIRDANGVDTLIPNNTFVEQSVTNWTYESAKVRFCIRVGVAYGSPVREVAQLLAECVARHGLVLKEPEPEILFENFGADSLEFAIYYWLEIGPKVTNRLVSSDLRFIIEKVLRENDISISYPQRDVHLDMSGPLKVQIAREE
jgi:small-conductance mechanosensitive channel